MKRTYTQEELARLHEELYDILAETVRVCRDNSIPYFLIGGTAIGALYDEAILPWDDDVDIGMTRDAYNRFLEVAPRCLRPQYFLQWQGTDPRSPYYFAKVRKDGTLFMEDIFKHVDMHQGIFVDIFPFDRLPDGAVARRVQRGVVNFLKCCLIGKEAWMWRHCGRCVNPEPTDRGFLPCLLNRIVDTLLPKRVIYRLMVAAQTAFNGCRTRRFNNIVTTTDHVDEEALRHLDTVKFGPLQVTVPHDVERFLRNNYPTLHRFTPEEQARISNHCPDQLVFSGDNENKV